MADNKTGCQPFSETPKRNITRIRAKINELAAAFAYKTSWARSCQDIESDNPTLKGSLDSLLREHHIALKV